MTKKEYLDWVKSQDPRVFSLMDKDYEVVSCDCGQSHCKGWITRFTDEYQERYRMSKLPKPSLGKQLPISTKHKL